MELNVAGHKTFCYTGGKAFDPAKPTMVFVHGVLNDHSVWILQTRYFAHHGWNVLAPDLPGHCRSAGEPLRTVPEMAQFLVALLDAAGVKRAALVGHSLGSLVALETAALAPERASHLALVGTAFPMKVSPALLQASAEQPLKAIEMVNTFSHSMLAPPPSALGPGTWLYGGSRALMKRVLWSNPEVNLFHRGFKACVDYAGGDAAMQKVSCPVLFVLGRSDAMTVPKMARSLQERAPGSRTVVLEGGHQIMVEAPDGVLAALKEFVAA
jgi:pimeloyl-ACP methyl ester carboxylesterase